MAVNTRELCVGILQQVTDMGIHCNTALHECMNKKPALNREERAFLTMLTVGTVERIIEMDYIINQYSVKKTDKMKPYIRNILRMSVYQIAYMDSVPDGAAVNEAVKLAVKKGFGGLKGYVNGVLRNIARNIHNIEYPDRKQNVARYLSVRYSLPEWLVGHFLNEMSEEELEASMDYYMNNTAITVRFTDNAEEYLNIYRDMGIRYERGHIFNNAYRLGNQGRIDRLPGYEEGVLVVQDESSMIPGFIAVNLMKNKECQCNTHASVENDGSVKNIGSIDNSRLHVLDMCAAPGGKSVYIASELKDNVHIDACDISEYKIKKIADNVARLKLNNISEAIGDALEYAPDRVRRYDVVIADLPCSGLGVIAEKPDIKYNVSEASLRELADIQKKMLDNAAEYVTYGGYLIYSTCTLDRIENEENAAYFLNKHKEYSQVDPTVKIGDYLPEKIRESIDENGNIRIIPGKINAAGFFVAVFRRNMSK